MAVCHFILHLCHHRHRGRGGEGRGHDTATSATSETTGKGGDHGGRGGTKKAEAHHHRDTTEAMNTETMTEAQNDHVRLYVASSNCTRVLRGKNSLNARKTWTELGEMPYHVPHEFSSKSLVKLLGKTPMRGSSKKAAYWHGCGRTMHWPVMRLNGYILANGVGRIKLYAAWGNTTDGQTNWACMAGRNL